MKTEIVLSDECATRALGASLAHSLPTGSGGIIGLDGALGAGKTTLARGFLKALRVTGTIRSPTYTLVEPYETSAGMILHLDLYRLSRKKEFLSLGLDDYSPDRCWWLVEWPDRADDCMPAMTLHLRFVIVGTGRILEIEGSDALVKRILREFNQGGSQSADARRPAPAGGADS